MEAQQIDSLMDAKPEEKGEIASNHQIDQEMREELGSKPVSDGFFADINNSQACSVRVAVKCRPLLGRELYERQQICLETNEENNTLTIGKDRQFTFDKVFGITSGQEEVFEICVKNLVLGCFQGYNATVLAYGQTGSGKTFTMGSGYTIGVSEENMGIIPRVNKFIFDEIEARKSKSEFIVKCAFIEIYNEELIDLLDSSSTTTMLDRIIPQKKEINIREEKNGMISVYPLKEVEVKTPEELAQCLDLGSNQRSVASTLMNQQSSRSHGIFTITIEQHFIEDLLTDGAPAKGTGSPDEFMIAKFHFVDLAGSERAKKTGATGATMKEGININKSLLSLGNVISALTDETKKDKHVPYRDSKLTRILQDSLGGNSRTSMIACCSPAETNFEETLNTLKYASRARNIKNKPVVNRDPASLQIAALRQQVYELQVELSNTRDVLTQNAIPFQSTIVLPNKSSLMQMNRQIAGPQPSVQTDMVNGAEIKRMEQQIQELKAAVSAKEKELQQTRNKLETLQDQHQQTQIDQFGAQRDRDLCRYQLEQIIGALKKHKSVFTEVVKEINHGKLPSDFNLSTSSADSILDPIFGSEGPTILQEYQTKVEEQRIEIQKAKLDLQQFCNDNQQLIEQANRDMKALEAKELEIERLKRQAGKLQKENEQARIDMRKLPTQNQRPSMQAKPARLTNTVVNTDDNWISNDLDNKIKHFEEVRKGFIEEMTNQMSKALVRPEDAEKHKDESEEEPEADEEEDHENSLQDALEQADDLLVVEDDKDDKEMMHKLHTQQQQVNKLDSQMLDMEEVLSKFRSSQRDMEQSLLKAMEEEYHNKILQMQNELKRLDAAKSEDLKKAQGQGAKSKIESHFKAKETELQTKLNELKNKEKEQTKLQQALNQQKIKSKQLESELENLKHSKVQMLKKMQDDQAAMAKLKKQRAQEIMDLKKQIFKKDKENDALKRENKKREIFAKRKQEEVIAMQQRQKLEQAKRQNATKQRQEMQNIDVDKIKSWIMSQTEKYVDYHDIENEKEREIQECEQIEQEIESQQEQYSKLIVASEKLEQQRSWLLQAPEGTQDDNIYSLTQQFEELHSQMKDIQSHIESLEDKQSFINDKISKYNCDLIRLKDPVNDNPFEASPLQTQEGVRTTVKTFFDILLDLNMALRHAEQAAEDKESKILSMSQEQELYRQELQMLSYQKRKEVELVHQEYMDKEHKLIQFMLDNLGDDLNGKTDGESLQDLNILGLMHLFLKHKPQGQEPPKDSHSINPGIVKAGVATQRIKEEKHEAFNQSKAALARQVADLERQLQEAQVINKRLKNDQAQAFAEKSKYKRLLDNELDKNKKRPAKEDLTILSQSHNFLSLQSQSSRDLVAQSTKQPQAHTMQSLQNQRNQRKLKKMVTTVNPNYHNDIDIDMVEQNDDEEEKHHSPVKDVFSRLTQQAARQSTRNTTAKHNFFGSHANDSPNDHPFDSAEDKQDLQQSWELVIDKPEAHKSQIYAMTSVGTHIYSSANKSLKIWDVETMNYISDLQIEKIGLVKAIAFWKERNLLLTAAERVIMMWDVISLTTVGKFTGFKEDIKALQLLQGTDLMFAASKGTPTSGALLIYDLRKYQQPLDEKERNQDIFSLTASSSHVFYGCRNHTVNPFCIKTFTSLASLSPPHFDVVTSLAVLGKQDSNLISGSRDKNLRRYSIKDGQFLPGEAVLNAHNDQINALETDKDKSTLYSGSRDGIVKVWSMSETDGKTEGSLTCRAILEGNQQNSSVNAICKLDIDPSQGQAFACGSTDRSIRIWKYTQGQKLHTQRVNDVSEQRQEPVTSSVKEEQQPTFSAADRLMQRRLEKQMARQNNL